jgi:hypothetical protein
MTPLALSSATWGLILLALAIVCVVAIVDVVRRDLSRQAKAAWILIVLLLPFVGTLLYFLLRKPDEMELPAD